MLLFMNIEVEQDEIAGGRGMQERVHRRCHKIFWLNIEQVNPLDV